MERPDFMKQQETIEKLHKIVLLASEACLKSVFQNPMTYEKSERFPQRTPGEWMSLVLLSSGQFRIIFKIFFDIESVQKEVTAMGLDHIAEDERTRIVKDLMKEFCNLTAGLLKSTFNKLDIPSGTSLPLTMMGFDDFFFPFPDGKNSYEKTWCLKGLDSRFFCSCYIVALDLKNADRIKDFNLDEVQIVEGDMDLL